MQAAADGLPSRSGDSALQRDWPYDWPDAGLGFPESPPLSERILEEVEYALWSRAWMSSSSSRPTQSDIGVDLGWGPEVCSCGGSTLIPSASLVMYRSGVMFQGDLSLSTARLVVHVVQYCLPLIRPDLGDKDRSATSHSLHSSENDHFLGVSGTNIFLLEILHINSNYTMRCGGPAPRPQASEPPSDD